MKAIIGKAIPQWATALWSEHIGPLAGSDYTRKATLKRLFWNPRVVITTIGAIVLIVGITWLMSVGRESKDLQEDIAEVRQRILRAEGSAGYVHEVAATLPSWKRAAERGSTEGMYFYARCLQEGAGVPTDEPRRYGGIARPPTRGTTWR